MKRVLPVLAISAVLAVAMTAELRREAVPMDRVPWELAEQSLTKPMWWDAPHIPSDHPYWWTLTDELSPQERRAACSGPARGAGPIRRDQEDAR